MADAVADGFGEVGTAEYFPSDAIVVASDWRLAGGSAASKVCHTAKHATNRTDRAVAAAACANGLALDTVFFAW